MTIDKIWEENFRILSFHMDPQSKAHLTSICNFLQEGAGAHAESAGFGFEDMMKRNQVWVLSRLKVEIDKYPVWQEEIKLNTWSRGRDGIFYIRDFFFKDNYDKKVLKATSSWAAINVKTRRPEIVAGLEEGLQSQKNKMVFNERLNKLPGLTNPVFMRKRTIEYTDIDLVYHVNNVKYIELIINSFTSEILMSNRVKNLEINYLGEAKFGEEVMIYNEKLGSDEFLMNVIRASDNKEVCRAKVYWDKI